MDVAIGMGTEVEMERTRELSIDLLPLHLEIVLRERSWDCWSRGNMMA
jgi:hypothetical protein